MSTEYVVVDETFPHFSDGCRCRMLTPSQHGLRLCPALPRHADLLTTHCQALYSAFFVYLEVLYS